MNLAFAFEVGCSLIFQVAVVIALTMALNRWLGQARGQCKLWTLCFVLIIALVLSAWLLPHRRLFDFPSGWSRETILLVVIWQARIGAVLMVVWLAGVMLSLLRRGILFIQLHRFLRERCTRLDPDAILSRAGITAAGSEANADPEPAADQDRTFGTLRMLASDQIQGPFCWQLYRPVIVLPTYLLDEDDDTLRHVLLHELEHLRTQHPMQHFLQGICCALFWFHPAVWIAARGAELTREFLCDEVAAIAGGKFAPYLRTLAKIAARCQTATCTKTPSGALAFGNRNSTLVQRSDRLVQLATRAPKPGRMRPLAAGISLIVSCVLVQQIWLPTNALASNRSPWSPWPAWTARTLHTFDINVRDFERFDDRSQIHELLYDD